jgi:hypothetical protein
MVSSYLWTNIWLGPPPAAQAPLVLVKTRAAYQAWHDNLLHLKRIDRYTIGEKVDDIFTTLLELIYRSSFASDKFEKHSLVSQAIAKSDLLKFFLQISWEHKIITHKTYANLIIAIDEIGKMLGGWKRSLDNKTPANI